MKKAAGWMLFLMLTALVLTVGVPACAEDEITGITVYADDLLEEDPAPSPTPAVPIEVPAYNPGPPPAEGMVFYDDDREVVRNTKKYPFVAVAMMDVHRSCGCEGVGTGFMVARNKLMTAAHMIVCSKHGQWADRITFYFGYVNDRNYAYKYNGRWYAFVGTTFPDGYEAEDDWAVVKLYENVGDTVGWFGFKVASDEESTSTRLKLLGYRSGILRRSYGFATAGKKNQLLYYEMDTEAGNSGGPLYWTKYDDPCAVAINVADSETSNYGHRITETVYQYFLELDKY